MSRFVPILICLDLTIMFQCDLFIRQRKEGTLPSQAGCLEEETLEDNILHKLSTIRDKAGKS
jgi:hypothetical protein